MIKVIIILILLVLIESVSLFFTLKTLIKAKKENKRLELLYNSMKSSVSKIEENISNANEEKLKLNTGNSDVDLDNATDILHKYAQRRRS